MSFEELLNRISPTLKRITYKLNSHFSFFNDDDLYQEALLHLWQDYSAGKLDDKTDSYILQGCYFHLKNYIRKVRDKSNPVSLNAMMDEEGSNLEGTLCLKNPQSCFDDLETKIFFEEIQNNGFTQRQKEVLLLCLEGLTTREIGKRLGISHVMIIKVKNKIRDKCNEFME